MYAEYNPQADTLIFDPHRLSLEPQGSLDITERGVSVVGPDTFYSAYFSNLKNTTYLASVHVDPKTHHMTVASKQPIREGIS